MVFCTQKTLRVMMWPAGTFHSAVYVFVWMMAACQRVNEVAERADSAKAEGQSAKLNEKATKERLTHTYALYTHTHTRWFLWFTGTFHRRNGFYTVQAVCAIALHLPYT